MLFSSFGPELAFLISFVADGTVKNAWGFLDVVDFEGNVSLKVLYNENRQTRRIPLDGFEDRTIYSGSCSRAIKSWDRLRQDLLSETRRQPCNQRKCDQERV
jgi:hypothetical protein